MFFLESALIATCSEKNGNRHPGRCISGISGPRGGGVSPMAQPGEGFHRCSFDRRGWGDSGGGCSLSQLWKVRSRLYQTDCFNCICSRLTRVCTVPNSKFVPLNCFAVTCSQVSPIFGEFSGFSNKVLSWFKFYFKTSNFSKIYYFSSQISRNSPALREIPDITGRQFTLQKCLEFFRRIQDTSRKSDGKCVGWLNA